MSREIHNTMVNINTQKFEVAIYVNTNKYNPANANQCIIVQQEQHRQKEDQEISIKILLR